MIVLPGFQERWNEYEALGKQPLRLTLTLRAGAQMAGYDPLALDGLLAWSVVQQLTEGRGVPDSGDDAYLLPVPLECLWRDTEGYPLWAVTLTLPEGVTATDVSYRHKKHQSGRFTKGRRGRFNISPSDGRFMERRVPVPTQIGERWVCECIGNAIEVGRLLEYVRAVGKERARGFGAVDHWLVEPDDQWWLIEDGRLVRSLPVGAAHLLGHYEPTERPGLGSWTNPGWKPALWRERWRAGTSVEMLKGDWQREAQAV